MNASELPTVPAGDVQPPDPAAPFGAPIDPDANATLRKRMEQIDEMYRQHRDDCDCDRSEPCGAGEDPYHRTDADWAIHAE